MALFSWELMPLYLWYATFLPKSKRNSCLLLIMVGKFFLSVLHSGTIIYLWDWAHNRLGERLFEARYRWFKESNFCNIGSSGSDFHSFLFFMTQVPFGLLILNVDVSLCSWNSEWGRLFRVQYHCKYTFLCLYEIYTIMSLALRCSGSICFQKKKWR